MEEIEEIKSNKKSGYLIKQKQDYEKLVQKAAEIKHRIGQAYDKPHKYIHDAEETVEQYIKTLESSENRSET